MHKLSIEQKLFAKRQQINRWRRLHRQKMKARRAQHRAHKKITSKAYRARQVVMPVPVIVKIKDYEPRGQLLAFIEHANRILMGGGSIRLDFSKITELHPCGTLIFMANFDIWIERYPGKIQGNYPDDEVVEQLLQHFKVMEKLGLPNRKTINHDRVRFWHYKSGKTVDAAAYRDLATTVRDNIEHPERELFADCLNEAVANTVGHAYDFEKPWLPPHDHRKWWVVSSLRDEHVFVAIYDMGVTIPGSLRRKPELSDFLRLRRFKDARLIEAATASSRTSTRLPHRGKGLPEMLEFSRNLASGFLSIVSGRGAYYYDPQTGVASRKNLECTIPGTLVLWQIPFEQHIDERENDLNS
ncbi:hypothetical protein [Corticimicrobacter populi]|uniref:hypothetical protein n=1 Tax=Corticimicrobacter populi TaxID=2175229 RepID=UPI0013901AE3|nr:hypothetical protein [Corticimicrobacter populi]